jgi:hypothetical protein
VVWRRGGRAAGAWCWASGAMAARQARRVQSCELPVGSMHACNLKAACDYAVGVYIIWGLQRCIPDSRALQGIACAAASWPVKVCVYSAIMSCRSLCQPTAAGCMASMDAGRARCSGAPLVAGCSFADGSCSVHPMYGSICGWCTLVAPIPRSMAALAGAWLVPTCVCPKCHTPSVVLHRSARSTACLRRPDGMRGGIVRMLPMIPGPGRQLRLLPHCCGCIVACACSAPIHGCKSAQAISALLAVSWGPLLLIDL